MYLIVFGGGAMNGQELMVRESSQVGQETQADNDGQVIAMWLHGRPHTTQRAYSYEVQGLLAAVGKPLVQITLGDLQGYFSTMATLAPASQARAIHATKSLFAFAKKIGYLIFNPGTPKIILASGTGIGKPFSRWACRVRRIAAATGRPMVCLVGHMPKPAILFSDQ